MLLICVVCGSHWEHPEGISNSLLGSQDHATRLYTAFCQQMNVPVHNCSSWDFSKDNLPFCFKCKDVVQRILDLNNRLKMIENELTMTSASLKATLENSKNNWQHTLEALNFVEIDPRVAGLRAKLDSSYSNDQVMDEGESLAKRMKVEFDQEVFSVSDASDLDDEDPDDDDSNDNSDDEWSPEHARGKSSTRTDKAKVPIRKDSSITSTSESEKKFRNSSVSGSGSRRRGSGRIVKENEDGSYEYCGYNFVQVEGGYMCALCPSKVIKWKKGVMWHIRQLHTDDRIPYNCSICGKHCDSPSALHTHVTSHGDIRDCICSVCAKGFKNMKNLKRHIKETHKLDPTYICKHCYKWFEEGEDLRLHCAAAHSENIELKQTVYCDSCGRDFTSSEKLQYHMESHRNEGYFKCFHCAKYYLQKENLKEHLVNDHGFKP